MLKTIMGCSKQFVESGCKDRKSFLNFQNISESFFQKKSPHLIISALYFQNFSFFKVELTKLNEKQSGFANLLLFFRDSK